MPDWTSHRLPSTVTPERYEIRLTPDLSAAKFAGEERVAVKIHAPVREMILNAVELEIQSVAIADGTGRLIEGNASLDEEREQAIVRFAEELTPGSWNVQIRFCGILNDKLHGFYRSSYKDAQGREKTLASTQFESTDARRAFPCWDEPALKAVFQITLVIDQDLTALSNARTISETPLPGTSKKEVQFADTIKMSTYLVAFIIGEFEGSDPVVVGNAPLRVWCVPGKRALTRFAREIGRTSLEHFSRYYDIAYPGDKLDLIAIPDFASGAMENLGAITFRETALLVDEQKATRAELERVADVVSHENAHMWFGDLVTMRWWNGLWLNEAFATFMEMLAVDAWKPEWRRWESFNVSRAAAMQVDGLKSTRAIEFPVEKPDEAAGMFDVLTYEKGASVLRMLEQYLGPEAFRDGIRLYLRRHEYANAETTDLWDAIEESTQKPVRAMMDTWIFQAGFPVLKVERENTGLKVSQRVFRYLEDRDSGDKLWHVPLFLRVGTKVGDLEKTIALTCAQERIEFTEDIEWAVVNAGGHGFYRVSYGSDLLAALKQGWRTKLLPVERFNLINDSWATTLAGLTALEDYLGLLDLCREETDLNVWSSVIASNYQLNRILDQEQCAALRPILRAMYQPALEGLSWDAREGESELKKQLRGDLVNALGVLGEDRHCQKRARGLYTRFEKDKGSMERNLVPALVSIVAHTGDADDFEKFRQRFKSAQTPQEETRYLFALGSFRRPELIERTLQMAVNGEVRTQNAPYLMRSMLFNRDARAQAWSFMKEHWEEMVRQYPDNSIPRMCEGIIGLATPELEADVREFFSRHPVKQGVKQMEQHLERLRIAVICNERWKGSLRRQGQ